MKKLIAPIIFFVLITALTLFGFKAGLAKILELRTTLAETNIKENILKEKAGVLGSLQDSFDLQANPAVASIPEKNPALFALSQLKNLAQTKGIFLANIKVGLGANELTGISPVDISFDVEGNLSQVLDFTGSIKTITPLTRVTGVEFGFIEARVRATVSVKTYWAPYPIKIPSLVDPAAPLSADEKEILLKISQLSRPSFINLLPSSPTEVPNPFGELPI